MKKINISYWIVTGLFAAMMLFSAIPNVMNAEDSVKFMTMLGYPPYFGPFIGIAKVLGVIGILIPGYPRIKEWAYAGLIFDLVGATYSVYCISTSITDVLPMLIFVGMGVASYALYVKRQKAREAII